MKWAKVGQVHHLKKASVSAKSTPRSPERGEGPFTGVIICEQDDCFPRLHIGEERHMFAWWWDVEILD